MKAEVKVATIQAIMQLLQRVNIQGHEANTFMLIVQELTQAVKTAQEPELTMDELLKEEGC